MKVNTRRLLIAGAASAITALVLSGCSGGTESTTDGSSAAAAGSLTIWVDADRAPVIEEAAAAFTESSGVDVELVQKDFADIQEDFVAQVPTGEGPDITIGAHDWLGNFVTNGVVQPVELGDTAAGFEDIALQAVGYNGNNYGVPYSIESIALLRNTDLAPDAPADYDAMIAAGEEAGTEFPFLVQQGPESDPYHLYPFQASFGNQVFATDADGNYDPNALTLGDESGVAFAEWLGEQGEAGLISTSVTGDIAKEKFNNGDTPFFITGPWNVADAQDAGISVAVDPIPSAGGQDATPFVGVQAFFLSAKSGNTLAANEFLTNFIATEDVQTQLFEVGGRAPALTAAAEAAAADPIIAAFSEVGAGGVPMPAIPEMGQVWQFWGVTEAGIVDGGDAAALWEKMAADVQSAIE
ncbi:MAG: sugar ABC transporter substrate-binding protein [Mycetocola sp.]